MRDRPTDAPTDEPWWLLVAICIVGVFVLAGPPVGAIATWIAVKLMRPRVFSANAWPLLVGFVLYSYWAGLPFALASGVLHAIAGLRFGNYSVGVSLLVSASVAVFGVGALAWIAAPASGWVAEFTAGLILYGPACIVGSLCCWALTRKLAASPQYSKAPA